MDNRFTTNDKIALFSVIVTLITGLIGATVKLIREHNERKRQRSIYDRSNGCYIECKRALRKNEFEELDRRRRNGETTIQILSDMRLIKNIKR